MPATHRTEAVAAMTAGAVLLALAPGPVRAARTIAHTLTGSPDSWSDPTAPVVALVALVAWALAAWLVAAALLLLAVRLPGLAGRLALGLAARTVPLAVRRGLEVALGASLAVTPIGTLPASADTRPGTAGAAAADSLDWPTLPVTPERAPGASPAPTTGPAAAPGSTVSPGRSSSDVRRTGTAGPAPADPARAGQEPRTLRAGGGDAGARAAGDPGAGTTSQGPGRPGTSPTAAAPAAARRAVVAPGDTLWALAERSQQARGVAVPTDAAVATAWPSWWAANRDVIGDDPDLLRPGTSLRSP